MAIPESSAAFIAPLPPREE
jgi:hypothetical protein